MKLPDAQRAVLEAASANEARSIERLAAEADLPEPTVVGAAFTLEEEGLVGLTERIETDAALTEEGREYADTELPELALHEAVVAAGGEIDLGSAINEADLEGPQVDIALSNFSRKGYGTIDSGQISVAPDADPADDPERLALATLADDGSIDDESVLDGLAGRNLVAREETTVREVTLADDGVTALMEGIEIADTVGALTPEMLTTGEWRDADFAAYNVEADAERAQAGRLHPLRRTAERVTDVLVGMGFEEMDGPHADAEFWINDCLFMPQDHPARTHWDQFTLATPEKIDDLPDELVAGVEHAHREGVGPDGDGYHSPWSTDIARRLSLRGHTTSLSARHLAGVAAGELEPPQRLFSVEKVYRNDTLDATHLLEFFQIEGLVMAEDLSVRDLMGTFTEFYAQFGITDLEFKPTYNPYTEPSFELFGEHPTTGELVEIGNSGLFRPEMLDPLGIDCDVMAWGLALERLLMLTHGFEDIRDVHGTLVDLDFLRNAEVVY
ncbi:phenylalanine--tRNA ligase subunit alpha [Halococcus qingdaonensis]|uniref:phenylalanine--tRNA ligase subunit alpha n=1 Tax=Halococcus qingdaonensis TaxID=224402 RepID=UPI00211729BE|nr:phenylalanine--tRNA ligase subunit alpha [Halococcus qingdaonensis]